MKDIGDVPTTAGIQIVTFAHKHETLKEGDEVKVVKSKKGIFYALRISDLTLHDLQDGNEQYIHVEPKL